MSDVLHHAARLQAGAPSASQLRAARALLDWSMVDLAMAARLSVSTIKRMETGQTQPVSADAFRIVRAALEAAGIGLLADDTQGEGVWLARL